MYIWGIGRATAEIVGKHISLEQIEGFIDNRTDIDSFMGKKVYSPKAMLHREYNAIVVITTYSKEIYQQALQLGMDMKKMIFVYGNYVTKDLNEDYAFVKEILGETVADIIRERYQLIRIASPMTGELFLRGNQDMLSEHIYEDDVIRIRTLELVAKEIKKQGVEGNAAEVGVFRGEFAQYINRAFPDRKLYLIDTFKGFNYDETREELNKGHVTDTFLEVFKDTSIDTVMERMKYKENIVIKQVSSVKDLNSLGDLFAFVSLDVDFEQPIYDYLSYFYPRLAKGGYIFIHDYNSALTGVEKAVDRYEKEIGGRICKVPVCDSSGTMVITK